jgi:hypothetical protein
MEVRFGGSFIDCKIEYTLRDASPAKGWDATISKVTIESAELLPRLSSEEVERLETILEEETR